MSAGTLTRRDQLLGEAAKLVGIPYRLDPPPDGVNNLDCSLYVIVTFRGAGLPFPSDVRTAEQIRQCCDPIDFSDVQPGDLLFFEHTYEPNEPPGPDGHVASHVGISLGAGTRRMWDCHCTDDNSGLPGVGQTDIGTPYWQEHIFEARRPRQFADSDAGGDEPADPAEGAQYRVTDDHVRLRGQPGTAQPILEELGRGAVVVAQSAQVVEADGHQWRNVRAPDGKIGWVAAEFLQVVEGPIPPDDGSGLSDEPDFAFGFEALWPYIQASAAKYGADPQVIAAIMEQESGFTNWRVHRDGTGHGLFGLDDNGLLPDFEEWSGLSCGRGQGAISIPPGPQIDYCCKTIAGLSSEYGSAFNAARVWHRGPGLWQDDRGAGYGQLIRDHIAELFGP